MAGVSSFFRVAKSRPSSIAQKYSHTAIAVEPIYVDNHLLVVFKPAGMLSQEDRTGDDDVLTVWKRWIKVRYDKPGRVFLGLVHRLDRPASGVMVLARTSKAAARLSIQFRERTVGKEYLALVEGVPDPDGTMVDMLAKKGSTVRVQPRAPGAREARLAFRTLGTSGGCSLVSVRLETGRAHQIRVQFSQRGFPLLGDFRYGATRSFDGKNLALHAYRLSLQHPTSGEQLTFTAPLPDTWPEPFRRMVPGAL